MIGERYEDRTRLKVVKIKGGMTCEFVSRREEPLGFITHWVAGGNYMCPGEECPACKVALGGRWVGVLPIRVLQADTLRPTQLLEFTGSSWARLLGLARMDGGGSFVGRVCQASRRRDRSALLCEPAGESDYRKVTPLPEWVLLDAIATLYGLPRCLEDMTAESWTEAARSRAMQRLVTAVGRVEQQPA